MKRSEMLQMITDFLWKSNGDYGYKKFASLDAEELLDIIEKAGMLPPFKKEPCFCSMRGTCPTCSPNLFKSEWEPENDREKEESK